MPGLRYTQEMLDFLEIGYKTMPPLELTAAFNHRFKQAKSRAAIKATLTYHHFTRGCSGGKPNSGGFQKGHRPKNCNPIGHERVCPVNGYTLVKVAGRHPKNRTLSGWYRHKHVLLWEEHHGPVPEGYCLRFKDGDKSNITIENLMLLSMGESVRLNQLGYADQPEEIQSALLAIVRLERSVYEKGGEHGPT